MRSAPAGSKHGLLLRHYFFLALLGLLASVPVAILQHTPGYMDAEYYYSGGLQLAEGKGFTEEILWNYLDDPAGLPHPSHGYWMPLVSIVAAAGMMVAGENTFGSAQIFFLLIAALVPVVTAALAFQITARRNLAILSGFLAAFGAFYLSFITTTDAFGLYMLGGTFFFILAARLQACDRRVKFYTTGLLLGLLAGLLHLTRADGLLWIVLAMFVIWLNRTNMSVISAVLVAWAACLAGYLVVMGPWMLRNYQAFGALLAPGGSRALWFTEYNDLFYYPANVIAPAFLKNHGLGNILKDRLWALGLNLQTAIVVQGEVLLAPLIILGIWQLRKDQRIISGLFAWLATFGVMTIIFPYAGARGGFFHSGAALQPLWWAAAPVGLEAFIHWGARVRGWKAAQAWRVFSFGTAVLVFCLSIFLVYTRVIGSDLSQPVWGEKNERYVHLERALEALGASPEARVLVNNAPGYYAANGRSALTIPNGDVQTVLAVAKRYQAQFLLLEFNQLRGDDDLYAFPGNRPGVKYLDTINEVQIYELEIE